MQGAATQAMWFISEERQRSRCPPAAAPRRAAGFQNSKFLCLFEELIRDLEAGSRMGSYSCASPKPKSAGH